ncbi:uncharacterized protein LOC135200605 [Macrobrachium nipponense]|uniref:uncharacterized protein LOC135200605 n=1 Tax=Macrobrachium nipponense TaxID=159736 RepID=UPI0030C842E0
MAARSKEMMTKINAWITLLGLALMQLGTAFATLRPANIADGHQSSPLVATLEHPATRVARHAQPDCPSAAEAKYCSQGNGLCMDVADRDNCGGRAVHELCSGDRCTCCMKDRCAITPDCCSRENGVCINKMDSPQQCYGRTEDRLCPGPHCTCCKKHRCENTPRPCCSRGGTCVNIMDTCQGIKVKELCHNSKCTCCIP